MADNDWYKPHRPPQPARQPKPGELLFEFYRERDHSRWLCELRDDGEEFGARRIGTRSKSAKPVLCAELQALQRARGPEAARGMRSRLQSGLA